MATVTLVPCSNSPSANLRCHIPMDRLSPTRRSWLMSRIRSTDTKPEILVRSALHRHGFRYSLHRRDLPGTPDIVFPSRKKVLFVHGCFWHGHYCKYGRARPKSNVRFWNAKINANMLRDKRNIAKLRRMGWSVKVIWECRIKKDRWFDSVVRYLNERAR